LRSIAPGLRYGRSQHDVLSAGNARAGDAGLRGSNRRGAKGGPSGRVVHCGHGHRGCGGRASGLAGRDRQGKYSGRGGRRHCRRFCRRFCGRFCGTAIEREATSGTGLEIMVRTRSGQTWSIVQTDHGENFYRGEWVRMLVNGDKRTITR